MPLALLAALVQAAPPPVVQELTRIEHELAATWRKGDCAAWGAMLSDDWSVIHISGEIVSKAQALAMCKSPPVTLASLEVSELSIRAFGDSAVVTGRTTATLTAPQPATIVVRFTDVFVRRNSRWVVVASQATNLPVRPPAVRERRVTIDGLTNLRDLGGYMTADGLRVKWGLVYRSDQLAQLTEEGFAELTRRGITTICDLRRDDERQRAPTRWQGSGSPEILLRIPPPRTDHAVPDPVGAATRGGSAVEVADTMRASYASNVTALAGTYGVIFKRILDGQRTLVHCTAGKDRTGIFSALFLRLVGVPVEAVEEDYLLSNTYYATDERVAGLARSLKTSPDAARALLGVDLSYLRAAFQEIDHRYTSLEHYRRTMLGLSDEDLRNLKSRVLEP